MSTVLLPTAKNREAWRHVGAAVRTRLGAAVALVVVSAVGAVAGLAGPWLLGRIVDVIGGAAGGRIAVLAALLVGVAVVQAVAVGFGGVLLARLAGGILADSREQAVRRVLAIPVGDLEAAGSGDAIARVSGDVDVVAGAVGEVLAPVVTSAITIATTVVGLAVLDWRFALAGGLAAPIQLHTVRWYLRASGPVYAAERESQGARVQALLDTLGAIDTVHAYHLGDWRVAEVDGRSQRSRRLAVATARLRGRFFGRLNLAEVVGLGAILVAGFLLARDGAVTVGACTAAALYFHRLFDPINTLLYSVDALQAANAGLARLVGLVTMPVPEPPVRQPAAPPNAVVADAVMHRYGSNGFALGPIDLTLPAGRSVALVGRSGAGKTTLAKLIAGQLAPSSGALAVSGSVATVSQEIHVFSGTITGDLLLAAPRADDAQLVAALDAVGASGWVAALPDGLRTVVGEAGLALDGVQAQQLALARVLLADPDVVVLDEATAEAGSAGASELDAAARAVTAGRSAVVVAHRLSQARLADEILVVADGRVVERGAHAELVAAGGAYAELWAAWAGNRPV